MARNYAQEYANYQGKPEQIARRSERNKARRVMEKAGRVSKGDGLDVDHTHALSMGGTNNAANMRIRTESQNRSFPRRADGSMIKNTPEKKK